METKASHLLIGGFVLSMIALGFGFVYWIRGEAQGGEGRRYAIHFESSVAGLSQSSNVLFNGLRVGRVEKMRILPDDTRKTEVIITIRPDAPVRLNSRATIAQTGLTGYAAVQLTPGTPDTAMLQGGFEKPYPLIKADPALSSNLMDAAPEVLANINATFVRLNDLVAGNEDGVRQIIRNVGAFTQTLEANKDNIAQIINDVRELSSQLRRASGKLEAMVDKLHDAVAADGTGVIDDVKQAAVAFRGLADKLDKSVGDQADGIARQAKRSLAEVELFMKDGRRAAQSLDRVLERIERNPQSLIFGGATAQKYNPNP